MGMGCQEDWVTKQWSSFQAPPPPQPIVDQPGSSSQPSMASPDTETPMQIDQSSQQQQPTDTAGAKRGRSAMEDDDYDF